MGSWASAFCIYFERFLTWANFVLKTSWSLIFALKQGVHEKAINEEALFWRTLVCIAVQSFVGLDHVTQWSVAGLPSVSLQDIQARSQEPNLSHHHPTPSCHNSPETDK